MGQPGPSLQSHNGLQRARSDHLNDLRFLLPLEHHNDQRRHKPPTLRDGPSNRPLLSGVLARLFHAI
jgi:hypothetical protein